MKHITKLREAEILGSPATHRLVREVLALARDRDLVDAAYDVQMAAEILMSRVRRELYGRD